MDNFKEDNLIRELASKFLQESEANKKVRRDIEEIKKALLDLQKIVGGFDEREYLTSIESHERRIEAQERKLRKLVDIIYRKFGRVHQQMENLRS